MLNRKFSCMVIPFVAVVVVTRNCKHLVVLLVTHACLQEPQLAPGKFIGNMGSKAQTHTCREDDFEPSLGPQNVLLVSHSYSGGFI